MGEPCLAADRRVAGRTRNHRRDAPRLRSRGRDFLRRRRRGRAAPESHGPLSRQSHLRSAGPLGRAAADRRGNRVGVGDRRSVRRRGAGGKHRRHRGGCPDARRHPGPRPGVLRRFSRRADFLQTQAGSRRPRDGWAKREGAPETGGGRMSRERTDFLSRWSRRKLDSRHQEPDAQPAEATTAAEAVPEPIPPADEEPGLTPEEIAALPKVEDLTPESDIRSFLRKGVPQLLRNAALRRMWSLDPAIRDYVSEAREYAYDWNVPGGVPGNGPLLPSDDVGEMLGRIFGDAPRIPDAAAGTAAAAQDQPTG